MNQDRITLSTLKAKLGHPNLVMIHELVSRCGGSDLIAAQRMIEVELDKREEKDKKKG